MCISYYVCMYVHLVKDQNSCSESNLLTLTMFILLMKRDKNILTFHTCLYSLSLLPLLHDKERHHLFERHKSILFYCHHSTKFMEVERIAPRCSPQKGGTDPFSHTENLQTLPLAFQLNRMSMRVFYEINITQGSE